MTGDVEVSRLSGLTVTGHSCDVLAGAGLGGTGEAVVHPAEGGRDFQAGWAGWGRDALRASAHQARG